MTCTQGAAPAICSATSFHLHPSGVPSFVSKQQLSELAALEQIIELGGSALEVRVLQEVQQVTGLGKGKGGHMHLFDPVHKFSCSGLIGASLPPACGAGLAAKKLGKDWVAVAFFGEGAANQGAVHESLNLAALWKLPVVFVCEDNKWAISVPKDHATSIEWVADRASAYGMPGIKVAQNDALAVYEAAAPAIARARRGEGPSLIEVKTDRYLGHFQGDPEVYRPKDEVPKLREHDPIPALAAELKKRGHMTDAQEAALVARAKQRVADAFAFARKSDYPAPQAALEDVFA